MCMTGHYCSVHAVYIHAPDLEWSHTMRPTGRIMWCFIRSIPHIHSSPVQFLMRTSMGSLGQRLGAGLLNGCYFDFQGYKHHFTIIVVSRVSLLWCAIVFLSSYLHTQVYTLLACTNWLFANIKPDHLKIIMSFYVRMFADSHAHSRIAWVH